jgi:hypothetical protein
VHLKRGITASWAEGLNSEVRSLAQQCSLFVTARLTSCVRPKRSICCQLELKLISGCALFTTQATMQPIYLQRS